MDWARMPSLAALRALEAAVRHRSFSAAARELNVTPAAIAQHVRALEADLGIALVARAGRGIEAQAEAQALADMVSRGFATIAEAVEQVRADAESRPLMVTVTPSFASDWLMPRIGDFWARHPDIAVNISPSLDLLDLKRDNIDMAIRWGDGNWPGYEAEALTDGDFWVVVHPRLVKDLPDVTLEDAQHLPWVLERYVLEQDQLLTHAGLDLDKLKVRELNTNVLALAALRAGLGIAIMPRALVEQDVATGAMVLIHRFKEDLLGYYMVSDPGRVSARLRAFRKWLRGQARREKGPIAGP